MHTTKLSKVRILVMKVWNGDSEAFAVLYAMTCDRIYNYCFHMLGSGSSAGAMLTGIYSYAMKNILNLTDPELFYPWLRRIAFQFCYDNILTSSDTNIYSFINPTIMEELPFSERQILFLTDYNNLPPRKIASLLEISEKKVRSTLSDARTRIIKLKSLGVL